MVSIQAQLPQWDLLQPGAAVSFVMTDKDIALYLDVFEQMVKSLGQARPD